MAISIGPITIPAYPQSIRYTKYTVDIAFTDVIGLIAIFVDNFSNFIGIVCRGEQDE